MTQIRAFIPAAAYLMNSLPPVLGGTTESSDLYQDSFVRQSSIAQCLAAASYVQSFGTPEVRDVKVVARFLDAVDDLAEALLDLDPVDLSETPAMARVALACLNVVANGIAVGSLGDSGNLAPDIAPLFEPQIIPTDD